MTKIELRAKVKEAAAQGGKEARHWLLAFALVRGLPYRVLEFKTREHNEPSPSLLARFLELPVENVKAWLAIEATPALVLREATARETYLEKKRQRSLVTSRAAE